MTWNHKTEVGRMQHAFGIYRGRRKKTKEINPRRNARSIQNFSDSILTDFSPEDVERIVDFFMELLTAAVEKKK